MPRKGKDGGRGEPGGVRAARRRYGVIVTERRWAGSWLSGTRARGEENTYPGQHFGLPEDGPRSVAGVGRRIGALCVDCLLCMVISVAACRTQYWTIVGVSSEGYLLTAHTGSTAGKRPLGVRVI